VSVRLLRKFDNYIFDIDGTLLDSAADICGAVQEVLSIYVPEYRVDRETFEHMRGFIGFHLDDMYRSVDPELSREQLDEMIAAYKANYLERRHYGTKLFPGVIEALGTLSGRKGTATTKGTPTTRAVLEQFGLLPYFDHVQGTDGFPCKPAPDVLLRSMQALGANPEDCVFVGDSEADMEAGRRAGVKLCAVDYGYGNAAALAKWAPDFWISDLRELCQ
jgi:phosphoglycolate phosphatase